MADLKTFPNPTRLQADFVPRRRRHSSELRLIRMFLGCALLVFALLALAVTCYSLQHPAPCSDRAAHFLAPCAPGTSAR
jgi:hypothetical protein